MGFFRSLFFPSGSSDNPTQVAPKARVVRIGGWVGGGKKGPSIFLKFEYSNKQDVLHPNLASKVVYGKLDQQS